MKKLSVKQFPSNCGLKIVSNFYALTDPIRKKYAQEHGIYLHNLHNVVNAMLPKKFVIKELASRIYSAIQPFFLQNQSFMATTSTVMCFPESIEKALRQLHFKPINKFINANSGNKVTIWLREA